jgi:hypothetical protein
MISTLATERVEAAFAAGPVELRVSFDDPALHGSLRGLLSQYDAPWPGTPASIRVSIGFGETTSDVTGDYVRTNHFRAERRGSTLVARGKLGAEMRYDFSAGRAELTLPETPDRASVIEEAEQMLVLLLARAWAEQGWTPLHAGSLIPPGGEHCVLVCAPSGVGKTTAIVSLLRRGWRTLGDDKMLMREDGGGVIARGLARRFHLHPNSSRWFPELGDVTEWPQYSRWTDKRVVRIERVWPGQLVECAIPGASVRLERGGPPGALAVEAMDSLSSLDTLLRQVAIPNDPEHARPLVACIAKAAASMRSAILRVGEDAFGEPAAAGRLEAELRQLLP